MAGNHLPRNPLETVNASNQRQQWQIHYSRFFTFPSLPSTSPALTPLTRSKLRSGGSWLPLSSMASVYLINDHKTQAAVLIVSSSPNNYWEEHYISNLHFSWPQVSCIGECPKRGSRVVFASYMDSVGQVQKFAMRFSASNDSKNFMDNLKSLKDMIDVKLQNRVVNSEISSSDYCTSHEVIYHRAGKELNYIDPRGRSTMEQPSLNSGRTRYPCFQETKAPNVSGNMSQPLPSSSIQFLSGCSAEVEHELPKVPEEVDFRNRLQVYMTTSSFHDMLSKLERVIVELGGDLALQ